MRDLVSNVRQKLAAKVDTRAKAYRGPRHKAARTKHPLVRKSNRRANATLALLNPNRTPRPRVSVNKNQVQPNQRIRTKASPPPKLITKSGRQKKKRSLYGPKGYIGEAEVLAVKNAHFSRGGDARFKVRIEGKCEGWAKVTGAGNLKLISRK